MAIRDLKGYFEKNGLYDQARLEAHCAENSVRLGRSARWPHLGILHYLDAAVYDKAWTEFTLSCRGLVVDFQNRKLLAVPFFKFFNLGEKMAPSFEALKALGSFEATEKLDGSLGIAFYDQVSGQARVTTRGSLDSEHGQWATARLPERLKDPRLLTEYTLMFELIAACFQIVVDYKAKGYPEGLYLIGIRENATQRLLSRDEVRRFAADYGVPSCKAYPFASLDAALEKTKSLPWSEEGFVLRFDSSEEVMVKVKSPEYLRVHRFLSNLDEKSLLEILAAGQERRVLEELAIIPEEHRDEVTSTFKKFQGQAERFLADCQEHFKRAPKTDRKTFALWAQKDAPSEFRPFLFKLMDGKPPTAQDVYLHFYRQKRYAAPEAPGFRKPQADAG